MKLFVEDQGRLYQVSEDELEEFDLDTTIARADLVEEIRQAVRVAKTDHEHDPGDGYLLRVGSGPIDSDPTYRKDLQDAGRGHLLR